MGSKYRPCENANEPSSSIEGSEFFDLLSNDILKMRYSPLTELRDSALNGIQSTDSYGTAPLMASSPPTVTGQRP